MRLALAEASVVLGHCCLGNPVPSRTLFLLQQRLSATIISMLFACGLFITCQLNVVDGKQGLRGGTSCFPDPCGRAFGFAARFGRQSILTGGLGDPGVVDFAVFF